MREFIKNDDYKNVKVFLETAINYLEKTTPNPNELIPGTKTTYKNDYEEKKVDADETISKIIKKKEIKEKDPTLTSTELGLIKREIGMLKAFTDIVKRVDERAKKEWLPRTTGGKNTRKRRQQKRTKRNTRRLLK